MRRRESTKTSWRFGHERWPPARAACRRILSLAPRRYGGAPACRRPSWAARLTDRRSGVSRDGLEGVPNERAAPQTAWEPRRPLRWRRLPAVLARSTKRAFWRPSLSPRRQERALKWTDRSFKRTGGRSGCTCASPASWRFLLARWPAGCPGPDTPVVLRRVAQENPQPLDGSCGSHSPTNE